MEIVTNIFFYFFSFIILLSIIVFVHEFGHYIAAIINKVKVETFSIGFGKEIYGWNDKRGTRWKISILPFGGYVKMFGEDFFSKKKVSSSLSKFSFSEKNVYQKDSTPKRDYSLKVDLSKSPSSIIDSFITPGNEIIRGTFSKQS